MDILCVGMFRSGSTFIYNMVCELVERHGSGCRLGFVGGLDYMVAERGPGERRRVLKSHDGHESFAAALNSGEARAIYSFRDLRDVAYSLMHKFRFGFDDVVAPEGLVEKCLRNDAFWTGLPNVFSRRYEELIVNPEATILEMARFIGLEVSVAEARLLAEEYSLARTIARTQELCRRLRDQSIDLDDPSNSLLRDDHTQLHWNHCRSGRVGTWRELATPEQLAVLAETCGNWLIDRRYEHDLDWAPIRRLTTEVGFVEETPACMPDGCDLPVEESRSFSCLGVQSLESP